MNACLVIQNWDELAREANWSVTELAKKSKVSLSTLKRHFNKQRGKSPKAWLSENRQLRAKTFLEKGFSVKATAAQLGYQHANQFSREFKNYWGISPTGQASAVVQT